MEDLDDPYEEILEGLRIVRLLAMKRELAAQKGKNDLLVHLIEMAIGEALEERMPFENDRAAGRDAPH